MIQQREEVRTHKELEAQERKLRKKEEIELELRYGATPKKATRLVSADSAKKRQATTPAKTPTSRATKMAKTPLGKRPALADKNGLMFDADHVQEDIDNMHMFHEDESFGGFREGAKLQLRSSTFQ
jgi:hypothetical protein